MTKKNVINLFIILITSALSKLASHAMSLTNLVGLKILLFSLSVIYSLTSVVCVIRYVIHAFSSQSEDITNADHDKLVRKNKILLGVFAITFIVVSTAFCVFYFCFM